MLIPMQPPLILITNDDGIDSPGLHAAVKALLPMAELLIAAPANQQSGVGRSLLANPAAVFQRREIEIDGTQVEGWALDASPAVTVDHAIQCLLAGRRPDMVVSGINYGENLGTNVTVSGTVCAAIQAAIWDFKALAVSLQVPPEFHFSYGEVDWSAAIHILRRAVEAFIHAKWPEDVDVIKIDIPDTADAATPWHVCRQSRQPGWWNLVPNAQRETAVGDSISNQGPPPGRQWGPNDDGGILLLKRQVAITPLSMDMTARAAPASIQEMFNKEESFACLNPPDSINI